MNELKIGIVEDDMLIAESIVIALKEYGYSVIQPVTNYAAAMNMLENEKPDLVLLDISIKGNLSGIDIAQTIHEQYHVPFIFLTAFSDESTLERAKATYPFAYLVKPFTQHDLYTAIEIAVNNFKSKKQTANHLAEKSYLNDMLFIKQQDNYCKILLKDILYLESDNVYVTIYTTEHKKYLIRNRLEQMLDEIAHPDFMRIHRSYAVNMKHLMAFNQVHVKVGDIELPIHKNYKQDLIERLRIL